jgi:hypothetical protein
VPFVTLERFELAAQLAKLAARHGMSGLSLRVVRESLRGGPPVVPIVVQPNTGGVIRVRNNGDEETQDQAALRAVETSLADLDAQWRRRGAPSADVYEALREAVLPASRPDEAFPYPRPLAGEGARNPRSGGALLARWAVVSGHADELKSQLETRADRPMADVAARALLALLGREAKDRDLARRSLATLGDRLDKDTTQATAELACHAALAALDDDALAPDARALLDKALKAMAGAPGEEPSASVRVALARHHFAAGRVEEGRAQLQAYLDRLEHALATANDPYGNNDVGQMRRQIYQKAAAEFVRAGLWADALDLLGRFADAPPPRWNNGDSGVGPVFAAVARRIALRPARERYELLKSWTMPAPNRKSVRLMAAGVPEGDAPAPFVTDSPSFPSGLASNAEMLIASAKEVGALDALADELAKAKEEKVENAETLWSLVQIALGKPETVEPRLKEILAEWSKKPEPGQQDQFQPTPKPDAGVASLLIVRACLANVRLVDLGRKLALRRPPHTYVGSIEGSLTRDLARAEVTREGGRLPDTLSDPGLKFWTPSHKAGPMSGGWVAHQGHIAKTTLAGGDALVFQVPLTGRFELSADAYFAAGSSPALGYAGLMLEPSTFGMMNQWDNGRMRWNPSSKVEVIGGGDEAPRRSPPAASGGYNRLTIQVEPGKLRFRVNGHLIYEETDPSPASPWLVLGAAGMDYRNIAITGTPEVPREVTLTHADRLDGWITNLYGESRPRRLGDGPNGRAVAAPSAADEERDWSAADGEIRGRRLDGPSGPEPAQSAIIYHRPLLPGESVSYEFYFEPDAILAHPALGRLAFLLEPSGVRLHWMTAGADPDWTGLKADNVADVPAERRQPDRLPLKEKDWNAATIRLDGTVAVLELNGQEVYRRDVGPEADTTFGLYHDKSRTAVRVRNVVLRGNWPAALSSEQLADLTLPSDKNPDPVLRRARHALIGEMTFTRDAGLILDRARGLEPAKRYDLLAGWVLPNDDHPAVRLVGDFRPTDPAPPVAPSSEIPPGARRVSTGGAMEIPAVELVKAAREAGRLDDLAARIAKAEPTSDADRRGRLALLALVRAAQGKEDEAETSLKDIKPLLEKVEPSAADWERWPELVAADQLLPNSKLRTSARPLIEYVVQEQIQKEHKTVGDVLQKHIRRVNGLVHRLGAPETVSAPLGLDPPVEGWARVTHATASTRGRGAPRAQWDVYQGGLRHYYGHNHDFLYLRTPLRGDFEVSCMLFGWREVQLTYGGILLGLGWERKEFYVSHYGRNPRTIGLSPPLDVGDGPFRFRLAIKDGTCAAFVNDRKIYETGLPPAPDPWLALYQPAGYLGGIKDLTIDGKPTVPDRVELSALPELTGWLSDYYDEATDNDGPPWEKRGEEIVGRMMKDAAGIKQESVLFYNRPLLENGEVRYEFRYETGKALTHPALDRLVFLLDPEGVKLHRLTDAAYDRTGLAPDNVTDEPANRVGKVPLKPGAWNSASLTLEGDTVTLRINDVEIYHRTLEATNQRIFGLFHFADESEVRVRNVTYRGDWPKAAPSELTISSRGAR